MAKKKAKAKKKARKKRAKAPAKKTVKKAKRKVAKKKSRTPAQKKAAKARRKTLADRARDELKKNPKSQKKTRNVKLTPKQILFVDCYLGAAKRTATLAARMAGYSDKAGSQAATLMANPWVKSYLKKRQRDLASRLKVTQEKIAREMATLAFAKPTDFAKWQGNRVVVKSSDEIPDSMVGAIKSIKPVFDKHGHSLGLELRFYDKVAAAKLLAQHLGMLEGQARDGNKGVILEAMDGLHDQAKKLDKGKKA